MLNLKAFSVALILLATFGMTAASKEITPLELNGKKVKRLEVSSSLIGYTSTQVFYTLDEQRVVVVIHIDNMKKDFPITGKVCQFANDVTAEGIAKWLNNQHSDGLFVDVPEPMTVKLPAEACKSLESKLVGQESVNNTTYNKYNVEVKFAEVKVNEQFQLKEHKDTVKVYVVAK